MMTFVTRESNGLKVLEAQGLGAPHGFSARLGGVSSGIFESLNLGLKRGDDPAAVRENYRRFCAVIGAREDRLVLSNQVHGTAIRAVGPGDVKGDLWDPVDYEADGLMTDVPGVVLTIFTADCVPILLCDPTKGVVSALHAGWRGTAGTIGAKGVRAMETAYGCRPEDIRAAIGPAIGPCCFETDADVPQALEEALGELAEPHIRAKNGKFFVDLKEINRDILRKEGVLAQNIAICEDCTCCRPELYWSHRYTRGERGSQAAMIWWPEEGRR